MASSYVKRFLSHFFILLMIPACEDDLPIDGGPCQYESFDGTAVISKIVPDTLEGRTCKNSVVVFFDFFPTDTAAVSRYQFPAWLDSNRCLTVGGGINPPDSWVAAQGLTEQSEHLCIRQELTSGTCTPVIFKFSEIDYLAWIDYCVPMN